MSDDAPSAPGTSATPAPSSRDSPPPTPSSGGASTPAPPSRGAASAATRVASGAAGIDPLTADAVAAGATGVDDTGARRRRRRRAARRHISRSVKIILFLFVLNNFVIPQIGGARAALERLSEVNPIELVIGLLLEFASLTCYALLTRSALPPPVPRLHEQVRIQLATKAVTNTVPGGNAAGSALGYRLLTAAGTRGADAGFALAIAGIGSAVVLNLILWIGLLVSIPLRGFNRVYVTAALGGVILMGAFAFIVFGLVKGSEAAERIVRSIARRVRFLNEERMGALVRRIADRLATLMSDTAVLKRAVMWATLQWLTDAAALWCFLFAFGATADIDALIVSFGLANVLAAIPITPGGLGIIEASLIGTLTGFGLPRGSVALGVTAYRLAQFWLPIPLGALAYASLRVGPWSLARRRQLRSLRTATKEAIVTSGDSLTWAERYGARPRRRDRPHPADVLDRASGSTGAPDPLHAGGPATEATANADVTEAVAAEAADVAPVAADVTEATAAPAATDIAPVAPLAEGERGRRGRRPSPPTASHR